jgi:hypothetical protein
MRISDHVTDQLRARLTTSRVQQILDTTRRAVKRHGGESLAVIALRTKYNRTGAWANGSEGNTVIVIVRENVAVTAYFRRSTQPINTTVTRTKVIADEFARLGYQPV